MAFHATTAANNQARDYAHIVVEPLAGSLGAIVGGVDLATLSEGQMAEIRTASDDHLVVFFRDQRLDPAQLEQFTRRWGEYGHDPFVTAMKDHPHVVRLVKEADEKQPVVFGGAWHSDWSFQACPPAYTILYGVDTPAWGGDTLWCNMYLATEHASETLRSMLGGVDAVHSPEMGYGPQARHNELIENMDIAYGDEGVDTQSHPLLCRHPRTGREVFAVNPVYTRTIAGMRPEESEAILAQIYETATAPAHLCRFRWQSGSVAVWDNRCTMHLPLADYHGLRREMWRTTVAGEQPVAARPRLRSDHGIEST